MRIEIRHAAGDDIAQALEFYAAKGWSLASGFIAEIDRALSLIQSYPRIGHEFSVGYRRFALNRFPYLLHYRVDSAQRVIAVVAVTHQSRRPNLWRSRVEEPAPAYM